MDSSNAQQLQYPPRSPFAPNSPYSPLSVTLPAVPTHSPHSSALGVDSGLWFSAPGVRLTDSPALRYRARVPDGRRRALHRHQRAVSLSLSLFQSHILRLGISLAVARYEYTVLVFGVGKESLKLLST